MALIGETGFPENNKVNLDIEAHNKADKTQIKMMLIVPMAFALIGAMFALYASLPVATTALFAGAGGVVIWSIYQVSKFIIRKISSVFHRKMDPQESASIEKIPSIEKVSSDELSLQQIIKQSEPFQLRFKQLQALDQLVADANLLWIEVRNNISNQETLSQIINYIIVKASNNDDVGVPEWYSNLPALIQKKIQQIITKKREYNRQKQNITIKTPFFLGEKLIEAEKRSKELVAIIFSESSFIENFALCPTDEHKEMQFIIRVLLTDAQFNQAFAAAAKKLLEQKQKNNDADFWYYAVSILEVCNSNIPTFFTTQSSERNFKNMSVRIVPKTNSFDMLEMMEQFFNVFADKIRSRKAQLLQQTVQLKSREKISHIASELEKVFNRFNHQLRPFIDEPPQENFVTRLFSSADDKMVRDFLGNVRKLLLPHYNRDTEHFQFFDKIQKFIALIRQDSSNFIKSLNQLLASEGFVKSTFAIIACTSLISIYQQKYKERFRQYRCPSYLQTVENPPQDLYSNIAFIMQHGMNRWSLPIREAVKGASSKRIMDKYFAPFTIGEVITPVLASISRI